MALRIVLAIGVFVVLAGVAFVMERRRRADAPTQGSIAVPAQLDRADFPRPDAPWLVVLFTSAACDSCEGLAEKAAPLESADVAVAEAEYPAAKTLHDRYHVNAAPLTVIADAQGVVRDSFVGAFAATDLWTTLANLRQ
jgi:hypothetical protein